VNKTTILTIWLPVMVAIGKALQTIKKDVLHVPYFLKRIPREISFTHHPLFVLTLVMTMVITYIVTIPFIHLHAAVGGGFGDAIVLSSVVFLLGMAGGILVIFAEDRILTLGGSKILGVPRDQIGSGEQGQCMQEMIVITGAEKYTTKLPITYGLLINWMAVGLYIVLGKAAKTISWHIPKFSL